MRLFPPLILTLYYGAAASLITARHYETVPYNSTCCKHSIYTYSPKSVLPCTNSTLALQGYHYQLPPGSSLFRVEQRRPSRVTPRSSTTCAPILCFPALSKRMKWRLSQKQTGLVNSRRHLLTGHREYQSSFPDLSFLPNNSMLHFFSGAQVTSSQPVALKNNRSTEASETY
jgi:hypothetical protein